jgi:hypothetical protein
MLLGFTLLLRLTPGLVRDVISVAAEFMLVLLGLTPGLVRDVISVAAEFMLVLLGLTPGLVRDVTNSRPFGRPSLTMNSATTLMTSHNTAFQAPLLLPFVSETLCTPLCYTLCHALPNTIC